jgi:hypothetical protein
VRFLVGLVQILATSDPKPLSVRDVYDQTREGIDAAKDVDAEFTTVAVFEFIDVTAPFKYAAVLAFTTVAIDEDAELPHTPATISVVEAPVYPTINVLSRFATSPVATLPQDIVAGHTPSIYAVVVL